MRKFLVFNRLPIGIILFIAGLALTILTKNGKYYSWIFFITSILMIVAHYMIGPMSLIQKYVETGDIDGAQNLLARVKKPEWLYKPIRSAYYMLSAQMGMGQGEMKGENLDKIESNIRKSLETGMGGQKEVEGGAYMQLGTIAFQKGNIKEAQQHLKKALELGLPDNNSLASVYLQLSNIAATKNDFRGTKFYFNKAIAAKPTDINIKKQIDEYKKYISRIPG